MSNLVPENALSWVGSIHPFLQSTTFITRMDGDWLTRCLARNNLEHSKKKDLNEPWKAQRSNLFFEEKEPNLESEGSFATSIVMSLRCDNTAAISMLKERRIRYISIYAEACRQDVQQRMLTLTCVLTEHQLADPLLNQHQRWWTQSSTRGE